MTQESTQPLVKMSTRNISWGLRRLTREGDELTNFLCRMTWKFGSLNLLEPSGPHRACYGSPLPLPVLLICSLPSYFRYQWPCSLRCGSATARLLGLRVRIPRRHKRLSLLSVACCQVEVSSSSWSLVQRNPNECGV
jgi:hypothetical protein